MLKNERLPTEEELIINERIMGGCNHPDHTTETIREHGYEYSYLICTVCGERFSEFGGYLKEEKPKDYLKKYVPLYCEDIVLARKVVRHLESHGWKSFLKIENGKYRYSFNKDTLTVSSEPKNSELESICSAAVSLAKRRRSTTRST